MNQSSLIPMAGDQPNRYLLESLGKNSEVIRMQAIAFPKAFHFTDSVVLSFFETILSPTAIQTEDKWEMTGTPSLLVDMISATHSRPWETDKRLAMPLNRTHSDLVKFSKYDEDYECVLKKLKTILKQAVTVIEKRFMA